MNEVIALLQQRAYPQAITLLTESLAKPVSSEECGALNNFLGFAYEQLNRLQDARYHYQQSLISCPDNPEYYNNLGILSAKLGDLETAFANFKEVARLKPDAQSYLTLAQISGERSQALSAIELTAQAHLLQPHWSAPIEYLFHLVESAVHTPDLLPFLQNKLNENEEQIPFYQVALGVYYQTLKNDLTSQNYFKQALEHNNSYSLVYYNLIVNLHNNNQYESALSWSLRLYSQDPSLANARTVLASLQELMPLSQQQLDAFAVKFNHYLDIFLTEHAPTQKQVTDVNATHSLNFYHCYQLQNLLPIQKKLAQFYGLPQIVPTTHFKKQMRARPRIGFLSQHFYHHSVMHLLQRSLEHLMHSGQFESYLFLAPGDTIRPEDQVMQSLKASCDHFITLPKDHVRAIYTVAEPQLDILIYPEIGMNPFVYTMASQRLARFQMVMPGHPVTTGFPHMDYFLSSQELETENAQEHYSEKLVLLSGLPDYAKISPPPPATRTEIGLPEGNLYFCPMTLFKIHPEFDQVIKNILSQDPLAKILFLEYGTLHERLLQRFQKSIGHVLAQRILFLPWSNRETFYQRLMACNVILDSFYFGGGNTAYQALGLGCPIITLDLPWNRSRWTQTMYQMMGMKQLIAQSQEAYADLAVKAATDSAWNQQLRQEIQQKSAMLFDNPTWSESLLHFCAELNAI